MANLIEDIDPDKFDPNSDNPFLNLGVSNEDYLSLLSGSGLSGRLSESPAIAGATSGQATNLGKRAINDNVDRDSTKRTRFQET